MRATLRRLVCLVVCALGLSLQVHAVGTVTVTTTTSDKGGTVARYDVAWTSTSMGAVSGNAFAVVSGTILQVRFVPSATVAPTTLYDVTLVTANSVDVLNGVGTDLSATASLLVANVGVWLDDSATLDVVVANAGNAKAGTVSIWVRR